MIVGALLLMVGSAKCEPPEKTGLAFEVYLLNLQGYSPADFAIDEPVWIRACLTNTNSVSVSVWLNGEKNRGIVCRTMENYRENAKELTPAVILEQNFRAVALAPGEAIAMDIPLGEFMMILKKGELGFHCTMELRNHEKRKISVDAKCYTHFRERQTTTELSRLISQIKEMIASGDERMRIRMIRSCYPLPDKEKISVWSEMLSDPRESVQWAVVQACAIANIPNAQTLAFFQKALKSEHEVVRRRAAFEIENR